MRLTTARLVLKLWTVVIEPRLFICKTTAHTTRALTVTHTLLLKDQIQPKGSKFFSKTERGFWCPHVCSCTATKRKVCLGHGIEIQAMQDPPESKECNPGSS